MLGCADIVYRNSFAEGIDTFLQVSALEVLNCGVQFCSYKLSVYL